VLDVLDAEQELFDARVNLVRAQTNEVIAAFELLSVVGGMTARGLRLPTALYDPVEHYNEVRDKWIGFGSDYQADDSLFGLDLE
jgi:outer membrane protein